MEVRDAILQVTATVDEGGVVTGDILKSYRCCSFIYSRNCGWIYTIIQTGEFDTGVLASRNASIEWNVPLEISR